MTDPVQSFSQGYPAVSDAEWREKAGDIDAAVRRTADGIARGPLFSSAPGRSAKALARNGFLPWGVRQGVDEASPEAANAAILTDLAGGVSEISLRIDPTGKTGVAIDGKAALAKTLEGVHLGVAGVYAEPSGVVVAELLAEVLLEDGSPDLRGGLGLDPGEALTPALVQAGRDLPGVSLYTVDARAAHDAGGTEAQELGFMAAGAAAALRALVEAGLEADASRVAVTLAVDADVHLGIAKLRAARRMLARIAEAFGSSKACPIHAVTSYRMMAAKDVWTNLIRVSAAGFAGAAGGADAITVRPLTAALGRATPAGRRLARNLQIILQEEAHAGRVSDPAGGAYLHETLSENLAQAGWAFFQEIETLGGYGACLETGWLKARTDAAFEARVTALREGQETMVGVTGYPNGFDHEARAAGPLDFAAIRSPLPARRIAEAFEAEAGDAS